MPGATAGGTTGREVPDWDFGLTDRDGKRQARARRLRISSDPRSAIHVRLRFLRHRLHPQWPERIGRCLKAVSAIWRRI